MDKRMDKKMDKGKGRAMSKKDKKGKVLSLKKILLFFLCILFFFPNKTILSKELAPHKIFGHLILEEETLTNLTGYQITARLTRNDIHYIVACSQGPLNDIYYVLDIPLDDALKEGITAPGDFIDILVDSFVMLKGIPLETGQITQKDISLCRNTELSIEIQNIQEGADYKEDVLPIIRTWGCGVEVNTTLNGAPYTPGTIIHEPNHYTLIVDALDASGASKQAQVNFTRSSTTAEALNGEFNGLSGWTLIGNQDLISITGETSMDPGGYAATIDPPVPSESAAIHSDLIYVLADSIVDLSLYIYGKARDEMELQVISYADNTRQNPIPLTDEKIYPTVDYTWQKIATQLIILQDQYFIELILNRNDQTLSTEALTMDSISLLPINFIASTLYHNNLWIAIEKGTRNLLSGSQEDLGIFDDPILSTVSNLPNTTCDKKILRLKDTQILRDVYLTSGTYTLSFDSWSDQSLDFTVDIGPDTHTLNTQPQGARYTIIHTATQDGWCSIGFTNPSDTPIHITQVQMEQKNTATSYTPAGRSPGYLRIDLDERIDFAQQGQLGFAFSPGKQEEDLFLAGEDQWGIAYKSQTKTISLSMANMPEISVDLSPDGIQPSEHYHVLLSWDCAKKSLDVSRYPTMESLGYAEDTNHNTQITSRTFWIGSRLTGTNQSQPSSGIYGAIHFQTTTPGCVQFEETCAVGYLGNYVIIGDDDGDNMTICQGDCDNNDPNVYQGAEELCDGKDNNCDGSPGLHEVDADGDGIMVCEGDCDDADTSVYPGAAEICDEKDNDCNGLKDEEDAEGCTIYYKDNDEDG